MKYTVKETDDPEVFSFWNEYTDPKGKKHPMLCFTVHSDCLTSSIPSHVREHGDMVVEFDIVSGG